MHRFCLDDKLRECAAYAVLVMQESRYGTRSQSLIFITHDGGVEWVERSRQPDGSWHSQNSSFHLKAHQPVPDSNDVAEHEDL